MKNAINFFYNFNIDNIRMINEDYYFLYQTKKFILQRVRDEYIDYQAIMELSKILKQYNKDFFEIVLNKNNEVITNVFNRKYVLMIDNNLIDKTFDFYDIIATNVVISNDNKIINRLNKNDWSTLWKNKIDYFEMYINHNINKYLKLGKIANYFVGLGENAISYLETTIKEEKPTIIDSLVVSHKRLNIESIKQLYNPLSLIIDHPSRDISEFFKSAFFQGENKDIDSYINNFNLSNYGARLLIARLFFPSFFFDYFEDFIEGKIEIKDLMRLIDTMDDYELFLQKTYNELRKKYNIPEIKWIKKVDYSSTLTTPSTSGISLTNIDSIPSLSVTSIMLQ